MSNRYKRDVINFIPVASSPYSETQPLDVSSTSSILFSNHLKEWYLIQQEPNKILLLINKSDLLLINNETEIQIYSKIKFQRNNLINNGRIINLSDDRILLEQELRKRLTNIIKINSIRTKCYAEQSVITSTSEILNKMNSVSQCRDSSNTIKINSWFLVQFERKGNCTVHSVIDTSKFLWDSYNFKNSNNQDLFILDDDNFRCKTIILYASHNRNDVLNQLSFLTSTIFNLCFKDLESERRYKSWFLIQYSTNHIDFIYDIVNESDTIYKRENLSPDVVIYLKDDKKNILYQAVILKKSDRYEDLEKDLENIRTSSLFTLFPLEEEQIISNTFYKLEQNKFGNNLHFEYLSFSRPTQTDFYYPYDAPLNVDVGTDIKDQIKLLDEEPDYTAEELKLIRKLNVMEENMHKESNALRKAFYQFDRINTNIDREMMTLEYLLSLPDIM